MSKHHVSHVQPHVLYDVRNMTVEELEQEYDIEVLDDGTVWDRLEHREFSDIFTWAEFTAAQDNDDAIASVSKIGNNRRRYDDDY